MKQILLMIAVVALVGCGKKPAEESVFDQERPDVTQPSKPPAKTEAQIEAETKAKAEEGDAIAQSNLGFKYERGQGVEQNNLIAYAWRNIAATNGDQNAKKGLSQLAVKMTPAQIADAEELVKEMVKKNPKLLNNK